MKLAISEKAKGEQRRDAFLVVVAIADEKPFPIVDLAVFALKVEVGGYIQMSRYKKTLSCNGWKGCMLQSLRNRG
jgi:hypothetical protein